MRASTTVSLSPLSDADTATLVHELLETSVLPAEMQSALLARAGGNPLYAEEFVRMVAERGDAQGALPESVQGIIAARLDLLQPEEKELLQDAAVVGTVFWLGAVASLGGRERWAVEQALHALERRDLVVRERRSSVEGENEYAFRHVLVRDVAYGQIPRAGRGTRHALAAEWIEALSPERAEDRAEMLAHHYLSALELARTTGADTTSLAHSARRALRDAGDRALALSAFSAAARYYAAALELWPAADAERSSLLLRAGSALWRGTESGEDELSAARDAFRAVHDVEGEAEAETFLAQIAWIRGKQADVSSRLDRVTELLPDIPDGGAKASVLSHVGRLRLLAHELDEGTRLNNEALVLADRLELNELRAQTLNNLGIARSYRGDYAGAVALMEQGAEIARKERSPELLRILNNLLVATGHLGLLQRHDEVLDEFEQVATQLGDAVIIRFARGSAIPFTHFARGRWDDALRCVDAFIAEVDAGSGHRVVFSCLGLRAMIRLARGDADGALADAERASEVVDLGSDPLSLGHSAALRARILAETGALSEAALHADRAIEQGRNEPSLSGDVSLTIALTALGRGEEQLELLTAAQDVPFAHAARLWAGGDARGAAEIYAALKRAPVAEAQARLWAGRGLAAAGRHEEADVELLRAIELFRPLRAQRYVTEAEALLSSAATARAQPG